MQSSLNINMSPTVWYYPEGDQLIILSKGMADVWFAETEVEMHPIFDEAVPLEHRSTFEIWIDDDDKIFLGFL